MNTKLHFSSASDRWATPRAVYEALDREFHFDMDPCPLDGETDGSARLLNSWAGRKVYCNPPYGRQITKFLECWPDADLAVFLLPVRSDTRWFHKIVLPHAKEIRFLRGRLKFGGATNSAPFASMIVVFRKEPA